MRLFLVFDKLHEIQNKLLMDHTFNFGAVTSIKWPSFFPNHFFYPLENMAHTSSHLIKNFLSLFFLTGNHPYYCWMSDKRAIAVAMVTPVSLALVFNVACLTKNINAIHHLKRVCGTFGYPY